MIRPVAMPSFADAVRPVVSVAFADVASLTSIKSISASLTPAALMALESSLKPLSVDAYKNAMIPLSSEAFAKSFSPLATAEFADSLRPFASEAFAANLRASTEHPSRSFIAQMQPLIKPAALAALRPLAAIDLWEKSNLTASLLPHAFTAGISTAVQEMTADAFVEAVGAFGQAMEQEGADAESQSSLGDWLAVMPTAAQRRIFLAAVEALNESIKATWDLAGEHAPAYYSLLTALVVIAFLLSEMLEHHDDNRV